MDVINLIGGLLYQWDTGRKVKIVPRDGITVDEVQFSNGLQDALVVEPYTEEGGDLREYPQHPPAGQARCICVCGHVQ